MGKNKKKLGGEDTTPGRRGRRQGVAKALKWVGGATAVLSLIFGLHQLTDLVIGIRERRRHVEELLRTGAAQHEAHDFVAAWQTLEDADRLEGGRSEVRAAQESLAMDWLEDARLSPGARSFEDIVGKAAPVLDRALLTAEGPRKADLLAHRGWAEFLRSRDGVSGLQPERYYDQALKVDPRNEYAHAMLGYRALRSGGQIAEARELFSAALAAGRVRGFVRGLQLAGLRSLSDESANLELLRVVNDMRKNNEQVDPDTRSRIWSIYFFHFGMWGSRIHSVENQKLLVVVPQTEQLTTFAWLFDVSDFNPAETWGREYYRAILQEAAGNRAEALRTFLYLRSKMPASIVPGIPEEIESAIKRLSKQP